VPVFSPTTIRVPLDYPSIQSAIYNAPQGALIDVAPGVYHENIYVNQTVQLVGQDKFTTIIDGSYAGAVVDVDTRNVQISGFTVRNGGSFAGIVLEELTSGQTVSNNIISGNGFGVDGLSDSNTITGNIFYNNSMRAISEAFTSGHIITGNTISESAFGVYFQQATSSSILDNNVSKTSYSIYLSQASTGNTVSGNIVAGKKVGIYVVSSDSNNINHNIVKDGGDGIDVYGSKSCTVVYNDVLNNSYGIRLISVTAGNNNIKNNKVERNDWGFELNVVSGTPGNTFTGNWIFSNIWGLYMTSASANTIYHNNFVTNVAQVYPSGGNTWSSGGQGNYWSDYTGVDDGSGGRVAGDGIGDTRLPHQAVDNYPLMYTWTEHDIELVSVAASRSIVYEKQIVNVTVIVKNIGKLGVAETFNVTAKYDNNVIGTEIVASLASESSVALTFSWNTTSATLYYNYTISAEAMIVQDELNTANNMKADGEVLTRLLGDVNGDMKVDIVDAAGVSAHWYPGPPIGPLGYDLNYDINGNGEINIIDSAIISANWGRTYP
jgi:parallel beta-helix repeat protein